MSLQLVLGELLHDGVDLHVYRCMSRAYLAAVSLLMNFACSKPEFMSCESFAIRRIQEIHQGENLFLRRAGRYGTRDELVLTAESDARCETRYVYSIGLRPNGYTVDLRPRHYLEDGRRSFYSDETMVIRQTWADKPATPASPELR